MKASLTQLWWVSGFIIHSQKVSLESWPVSVMLNAKLAGKEIVFRRSWCLASDWSRGVTWPEACLLIGREESDAGKWLRASWLVFRSVFVMLLPWDEIPGLIIDSNFIIRVLNELSELSVTLLTLQFKSWLASLLVNEAVRVDSSVWGILHSSSWRWPRLSFLNIK